MELGQIGRELKKLWEASGGTKTRASLVNFAIICEGDQCLEENTQLIYEFTRDHACRAILIARDATSSGAPVQAWVNAHCHLPKAGALHVCCEQITFLLASSSNQLLLNALFANLDSDLPLYLWWRGELPATIDEQLWAWLDRLVFDSRDWRQPCEQLQRLQRALQDAGSRVILCDLNWTRTLHLRQAVAQMFDHPENLAQVPHLRRLTLTHAPGHASTAHLFAGWISAQLGWTGAQREDNSIRFQTATGSPIACELKEAPGAAILRCDLATADGALTISIQRDAASPFYRAEVRLADGRSYQNLLPADSDAIGDLLSEEINLGGRHKVYLKALAAAGPLL